MAILRRLAIVLIGALMLALAVASSAPARLAAIETTAPLADHSERSIRVAIEEAVRTALRGAVAMGLTWVQLRQADVLEDGVVVQILATDTEPDEEDLWEQTSRAETTAGAGPPTQRAL